MQKFNEEGALTEHGGATRVVKLDVKLAAKGIQHQRLCGSVGALHGLRQFPLFAFTIG